MSSPKKPKLSPHHAYDEDFEEIYKLVSEFTVVSRLISDWEEVNLLAGLPLDSQIASSSLSDSLEDVRMDTASAPARLEGASGSASSSTADLISVSDDSTAQQPENSAVGTADLNPVSNDLTVTQQTESTASSSTDQLLMFSLTPS